MPAFRHAFLGRLWGATTTYASGGAPVAACCKLALHALTCTLAISLVSCGASRSKQDSERTPGDSGLSDSESSGGSGAGGTTGSVTSVSDAGQSSDGGSTLINECDAAPATWMFCDGFESSDFAAWDDYDGNPPSTNQRVEEPGPLKRDGNHVGRLRVPKGRGGADFVKVLPVSAQRVYARWYVQWEPGYDFNAPNHGSGLHAGERDWLGHSDTRPNGTDWATAWLEPVMVDGVPRLNAYSYYAGMYMDCVDPNGSCWGDHFPCMIGDAYCTRSEHRPTSAPVGLVTGRWYCLEEMIDVGTPTENASNADGILDFWIDGTEIGPWTALWLRASASVENTILWLSVFHHAEHSVEGVLLDDVVLSTDRIGCH
jgi:hypothetical protein